MTDSKRVTKIKLLKAIDKISGKPLVSLLPRIKKPRKGNSAKFKKILIIRPGGIGDAVLLLPAINSLKEELPDSEIDILAEKRNAEIFGFSKEINRIYLYDMGSGLFKCLKNRYDVVIDTEQWHRLSAVAAYLAGAAVRVGFDTNERARLFTHRIPYSHDDYEVYSFLSLIAPLINSSGVTFDMDKPFLNMEGTPSIDPQSPIIAIFPGASVVERRWGGDRFGKVARALRSKGYRVVILGSGADSREAARIKEYAGDCIDLTGKTDLKGVAAILKESKLLLTADSGLMHIAYAVGTATVSLFGS
ncbi:ADP-heptose--lipooligosaccharide heptosyltransferase II, partial [hydrothermal vent metagenome]